MRRAARVTLIGRAGCHLCDAARDVVREVCERTGETFEERSIDDDPGLADAYAEEIPVVLVDGRFHSFFHVDPVRLSAALARP